MDNKRGYKEWVDIAKGIAMLSIMYSHVRGYGGLLGGGA